MKTSIFFIVLAIVAGVAHPAPIAIPQTSTCNPNPHGRSCTAILYGAAGQSQEISIPINYMVVATGVAFSVSTAFNTDTSNYEYITLYGNGGSTTTIPPDTTVAIGPPQPQVSAFCQIECPSS